jgi:hypothetical protein
MAECILIMGESGTGKSYSLRNFLQDEILFINVSGKRLPFRTKFTESVTSADAEEICYRMESTNKNVIVVDDYQYIMGFQFMDRLREGGWDKFSEMQSDYFKVLKCAKELPENKIVFFLSHIDTKDDGRVKVKTIGKMLDEKITVEGLFTVVLRTYTSDGRYYFITQNSGNDTVKSPMDMFPSAVIDNDLKYVADVARNYWYMDGAKTDAEMKAEHEAVKTDIEPSPRKKRKIRASNVTENVTDASEKTESESQVETPSEEPKTSPRRRRKARAEEPIKGEVADTDDVPFY